MRPPQAGAVTGEASSSSSSSSSDVARVVAGHLERLVLKHGPSGSTDREEVLRPEDEAWVRRQLPYVARIVGSKIGAGEGGALDELAVAEQAKRILRALGAGPDGASTYDELRARLAANPALTNRRGLLHLLNGLAGTAKVRPQGLAEAERAQWQMPVVRDSVARSAALATPPPLAAAVAASAAAAGSAGVGGARGPSHLIARTDGAGAPSAPRPEPVQLAAGSASRATSEYRGMLEAEFGPGDGRPGRLVPEEELVRDIIFSFQGVDGQRVRYSPSRGAFEVHPLGPNEAIPPPVAHLLARLGQLGQHFHAVSLYVEEAGRAAGAGAGEGGGEGAFGLLPRGMASLARPAGLVRQSFCAALQREMADYYRLLAVLEGQLTPGGGARGAGGATSAAAAAGGSYLSLRRLLVWTQEPLERMSLMASLVGAAAGLEGGRLLSALASFMHHGDPFVRRLVETALERSSGPLLGITLRWLVDGDIQDPFLEFFVRDNPAVPHNMLWEGNKYTLAPDHIPGFLPERIARTVLLVGKTVNFLRHCCKDAAWISSNRDAGDSRTEAAARALARGAAAGVGGAGGEQSPALEGAGAPDASNPIHALVSSLGVLASSRAQVTNARLISLLFEEYYLEEHCRALKSYLLLGQGDFIQVLMDVVKDELGLPAGKVSPMALAGLLEQAVRASNAQHEHARVLDRLRCELLPHSDGDFGWDVFSLDYAVTTPLDSVLTGSSMRGYKQIFNFLWRLKRVEDALDKTWAGMKPNGNLGRRLRAAQRGGIDQRLGRVWDPELRRCHALRQEAHHFVHNLQYYIQFEVLECAWADLTSGFASSRNLDDLIGAHEAYMTQILDKTLLGPATQLLSRQLSRLLEVIGRFCGFSRRLEEHISEEVARKQRRGAEMQRRELEGKWGVASADTGDGALLDDEDEADARAYAATIRAELTQIVGEYKSAFEGFLALLTVQGAVDCRFLLFRLDFNEVYAKRIHAGVSARTAAPPAGADTFSSPIATHAR